MLSLTPLLKSGSFFNLFFKLLFKGFLRWVSICKCVTSSLCVDRDPLFGSNPNSMPDKKTTYTTVIAPFVVAKGLLSCAFTLASLGEPWQNPGNKVVTLTFAAKVTTLTWTLAVDFWQYMRYKYLDHIKTTGRFKFSVSGQKKNVAGKWRV